MPTPQLLDEYGLNEVTYGLLLLAFEHNIQWSEHQVELKQISGQPAVALRKLVDRGLLTGPGRGVNIGAQVFALTQRARRILAKIERGLHRPRWLSPARARALQYLSGGAGWDEAILRPRKIYLPTLLALKKAGYVQESPKTMWRITDLGQEAWAEYEEEQANAQIKKA
jgi:hypothetical protein